jgi:N-acetylglucosamine-6-phosphate deacetylase
MNEALRNILRFTGCTLPEAVRMASTTPARLIGEGRRRGRLSPGHDADVVALSDGLEVEAVWKGGEKVLG